MDWTWDLTVLYKDFNDPKIERDFNQLKVLCEQAKQQLARTDLCHREMLETCVAQSEEISRLMSGLGEFASLTLATDANNEEAQVLMDKLEMFSVQLSLLNSELVRYIGSVDDLEKLIAESDKLQKVDFFLRRSKESAAHLPDPAIEEWLLKMSLSGGSAFSTLRDKLDATHMVDYRGESLPLAAIRGKAYDPDPQVRKDAYEAEIASYAKMEIPMAACLNGVKGEALTMIEAEHFDSVLDQTLFNSNMDRATLDAMLTAMREALPAFRKYLRKKGEILGHKNGLPFCMIDAPMPLAETASIFNETLLANAVLEQASKEERFSLLEGNLMEVTQVIVDILSRYLFESEVIERRKDHTLSVKELKDIMLDAQDKSYGDGLDPDIRHPYMWACKTHYYYPGLAFYNFPYAFGQLFGAGVFAQYKQEGASFVPKYCKLLRSCGSGMVADVAASVGIDVRSVDFWRESLNVYVKEIEEFIQLADELMK